MLDQNGAASDQPPTRFLRTKAPDLIEMTTLESPMGDIQWEIVPEDTGVGEG